MLSGGVWQNMVLFTKTVQLLEKNGFTVHFHRQVPANDGGLSLMGLPISFDGKRPPLRSSAPKLGDATEAVLGRSPD